jgi:hypothetical protein
VLSARVSGKAIRLSTKNLSVNNIAPFVKGSCERIHYLGMGTLKSLKKLGYGERRGASHG